MNSFYKRLVF
ncbi:38893f57-bacc-43ac-8e36-51d45d5c62f2 [Thermothielavioides terrestris]|uniref:38893f57-bacc-43ac-8e36-51d45d5c62f2 n=1 Tax=Thermothielavioides terrestris TaxID=2587410 RepID=A0A3S4EW40_9PEZI|nr:38893f57-bacc-43ac-8e36-51d45d5c62f2 [Thermothielavioides terrestris]